MPPVITWKNAVDSRTSIGPEISGSTKSFFVISFNSTSGLVWSVLCVVNLFSSSN